MPPEPSETLLTTAETWPYICGTPRRIALNAWLTTNGISPHDIPVTTDLKVVESADGPVVDHYAFLRNADGFRYVDPNDPDQVAMEHRQLPCETLPPKSKRSDITTLALLQCITDRTALRQAMPLEDAIRTPTAWELLCTVYPDKVVTAALFREVDRDLLDYGINVTYSFLTAEGVTRFLELGGILHPQRARTSFKEGA
ncbi:hypothetical protein HUT11_35545 (plasmid) [Streptomyces seoulensis]|nr:hypothetical protein HUT11_35545 [Streptomyces seoulensis]